MSQANEIYSWLINSLYILGVLLVPLGLSFLLVPEKTLSIAAKLNHWVSTEHVFDVLNKPRYQERFVYRHHRIFGIIVMFFTILCVYMMLFYTDHTLLLEQLILLIDSTFAKWSVESLFYILIIGNILAFIIGLVIFIRPSMLKNLESKSNHWVETDNKMKFLDSARELPESILLKHPRIFGTVIMIAGIYIIMNIGKFIT